MRCYKKPFSWEMLREESVPAIGGWKPETEWVYFVHVCGFRFVFYSIAQIAQYRNIYAQPLKPSFRWRDTKNGEHSVWQDDWLRKKFNELPLYLWQKGKRQRVVAGLSRAIHDFAKGRK